jgi:Ni/Fe-hydrogenase 1 B-type cytochrome subunit
MRAEGTFVCEWPVRTYHWVMAATVVAMCVTGWFIQHPPAAGPGEAQAHFLVGYIRLVHFAAGYVCAVALIARLYWALVGNRYAREPFILPVGDLLRGHLGAGEPTVTHNVASRLAIAGFTLLLVAMMVTGFALYGAEAGRGSWAEVAFGWLVPLLGSLADVHYWHAVGMWLVAGYAVVHVYKIVSEEAGSGHSMVSVMVSGIRYVHEGAENRYRSRRR